MTIEQSFAVNHDQAANLVLLNADAGSTTLVEGSPGIGKSDLHRLIQQKLASRGITDHTVSVIDCQTLDIGDLAMPVVNHEKGYTQFVPNQRFGVHRPDRPVLLVLDEVAKSRVIANLLPLLLEHRIGDTKLPSGSIVYATTNLSSDALGDVFPPHARNRVCSLQLKAPSFDEWLVWASNNGVASQVIATVKSYPTMLESYLNPGQEDNPFIYNPRRGVTETFCSPRSLARCSPIARAYARGECSHEEMRAGLIGWLGVSGGSQMVQHVVLGSAMPTIDDIVNDPVGSKLKAEKNPHLQFFTASAIGTSASVENFDAVIEWAEASLTVEAKTLMARIFAHRRNLQAVYGRNKTFMRLIASVASLLGV